MSTVTRSPLNLNQKRWIIKRVTLNHKYADIIDEFEKKWGRRINPATVMRLKQKNLGIVTSAQAQMVEVGAIQAASLKHQTYRLMQHKMNQAEEDVTELDRLRKQWQNHEIDDKEYDYQRARYRDMTVSELVAISNTAHTHGKGEEDNPATPQDKAALEMLVAGIQSGNPLTLIQVLNPTINQGARS